MLPDVFIQGLMQNCAALAGNVAAFATETLSEGVRLYNRFPQLSPTQRYTPEEVKSYLLEFLKTCTELLEAKS